MKLGEKVSYLKGLIEGLELKESAKEGKVIALMADILQDMALEFEDLQDQIDEVVEVVDVIDEDLGEIEHDFYDDDCCCDDDFDDEDYEDDEDDDYDFLDEDDIYEVTCPSCKDSICLNEDMIDQGSMSCPGCGELLEFELSDDD